MSNSNARRMEGENQPQLYESKQLNGKVAVIFGAGGATGSQIAREFSREGAKQDAAGQSSRRNNETSFPGGLSY